jgi:hypothetical protein
MTLDGLVYDLRLTLRGLVLALCGGTASRAASLFFRPEKRRCALTEGGGAGILMSAR